MEGSTRAAVKVNIFAFDTSHVLQHNGLRVAIKLGENQDFVRSTLHLIAAIVSRNSTYPQLGLIIFIA